MRRVAFLPPDPRFGYEPTKNTPTVLEPFQDTVVKHFIPDWDRERREGKRRK